MDGNYVINKDGTVWSNKSNKYLTVVYSKNGYGRVKIYNKYVSIYRLVANKFIPNPHNLPTVNHIDEDKTNNHVDNLEWMTHGENKRYSAAVAHKFINPEGKVVTIDCLTLFCRETGLDRGHMYKVLMGERKQHKGWRRYNEC